MVGLLALKIVPRCGGGVCLLTNEPHYTRFWAKSQGNFEKKGIIPMYFGTGAGKKDINRGTTLSGSAKALRNTPKGHFELVNPHLSPKNTVVNKNDEKLRGFFVRLGKNLLKLG